MRNAVLVVDLAIAVALVLIGLLLSPGPAVIFIGAVVVLVIAGVAHLVGRLLGRRRRVSGALRAPRRSRPRRSRRARRVSGRRR